MTTVQLENSARKVSWITLSVAVSTEAVASSSTSILVFFSKARPKQTSCLCPTLQFSPFSSTALIEYLILRGYFDPLGKSFQHHKKTCCLVSLAEICNALQRQFDFRFAGLAAAVRISGLLLKMMIPGKDIYRVNELGCKKEYRTLHLKVGSVSPKEQSFPSFPRTMSPSLHLSRACRVAAHK